MTCIVYLDAYELHWGIKKSSMTLLMNVRVLNITYDKGLLILKKYICILMLMTIYEYKILCVHFETCILSLKLYVHFLILSKRKRNNMYIGRF